MRPFHCPAAFSALVRTVLVLCLAVPRPAAADPDLSPLVFLPGDATPAPAAGLQELPAIAAGGPGFLAVWADARSSVVSLPAFTGGPYFEPGIGTMRDIHAARLDPDGNLIDVFPIVVNQDRLNQGDPAVAWNGQNWLVAWMGQAGLACCPNINIYAARVSPAGEVLDDPPIVVDTDATSNGLYWPAVASDGANWVVVWRDLDEAAGIFTLDGARISPAGAVLDPGGRRLRRDAYNSYPLSPSIAFASDEYLLVWNEDSSEIAAQRLDLGLNKIGGVFRVNTLAGSDGKFPCVASDGSAFFVAWFEDRWYGWAQLFGARVLHAGAVLDPNGIEITPYSGYTQFAPCVVWDGGQWIVGYNIQNTGFNDDMFATRVSAAGGVLDPNGIPVLESAAGDYTPALAARPGGGARLVWQVMGGAVSGDIYTGAVSPGGSAGPAACVSLGAPRQTQPELAWNGDGYLAVFRSETSREARILGQRLDANGDAVDLEPFVIASGDASYSGPAVAWDGVRYLVAWSTGQSQVRARRLDVAGAFLDAQPIDVMPGNSPDVAALDGVFLVTATHAQDPHFRYPYSVRVRGVDGVKLDGAPVLIGSYFATNTNVRAFGGRWLVAWQQNPTHDNVRGDVVANFVSAAGVPGTQFSVTSTGITIEEDPFVSAGTDVALIGWADDPTGAANDDLKGRRIQPDGTFLDATPLVLSAAAGAQIEPEGDWHGDGHTVLFTDQRNDDPNGPYVGDVYGTRVAGDGTVLDPDGFAVSAVAAVPELHPAVAAADGEALLGCAAYVPAAPLAAYRIGIRGLNLRTSSAETGSDGVPPKRIVAAPNPSGGSVHIMFSGPGGAPGSAHVFDVNGRAVRSLAAAGDLPGVTRFTWDGRDSEGVRVAPGVYFVRITSEGGVNMIKVMRR